MLRTPDEVERYFPRFMTFIDCTEIQIPRPMDKESDYSSKRKRITAFKNQLIVTNRRYIFIKYFRKRYKNLIIHSYIWEESSGYSFISC